jgi:hypothetical protein
MKAIWEASKGKEVMIDVNHAYSVTDAIRLGHELEDMGWRLRWYEEPVVQEDLDGYAEVRRALATPIAGGRMNTRFSGSNNCSRKEQSTLRNPTSASPAASPAAATSCAGARARRAGEPARVGFRGRAGGVAAAHRLDPGRQPLAVPEGHPARVRHLVAPVPQRIDRSAAAPEGRLGGDSRRSPAWAST